MTIPRKVPPSRAEARARLARAQGAYYVVTGVWPLLHMRSFERVTGPKPERWLVKIVGALAACIGGAMLSAANHRRVTPELRVLGIASAASFAAVDVWYAGTGRIPPVYLGDAAVQLGLIAAWETLRRRGGSPSTRPRGAGGLRLAFVSA